VFSLTQDQVRVPFGVDVVQIAPSAIAMVFEPTASREVQVMPAIDGRPAAGYVVGKTTTEPETVEVVGPEAAVKRATEAVTEPVPVAGATERVRETVTLGLLDPSLRLKNVRSATVTVQIVPGPQERTFRNRAVHLRNVPEGLTARAEPTAVDVAVRGSRESLGRLEPDEVVAYVDLAGLGAGEYQLTVHAEAARDAGVTHIEPATVQIRMTSVR
jgi:YbbR domain-containing protein